MGKTGFIDLQGGWNDKGVVSLHVFDDRAAGYAFEKTMEIGSDSRPSGLDGIRQFYLSLPLSVLNFRLLKFPFSDRQKLKGTIPFELDGLILGGPEKIVFDSVVLGESGNGFDVVIAYVEKKLLKDVLAKFASMGIDPMVVTSIEARHALDKGTEDLGMHLINPEELSPDGRIAAAMRELSSHTVNLRTGPFAYTRDEEAVKKRLGVTAILSLLLALLINVDLAFKLISAKRETASLKKEMRSIYNGLFPGDKKIADELYQMKSHLKELKERGDAITGISPLRFVMDLSQRTIPGVKFDEVNLGRDLVTIKGETVSMDSVGKIREKLSEFLNDVSVPDIKTSVGDKVRFTVVGKGYKQI